MVVSPTWGDIEYFDSLYVDSTLHSTHVLQQKQFKAHIVPGTKTQRHLVLICTLLCNAS